MDLKSSLESLSFFVLLVAVKREVIFKSPQNSLFNLKLVKNIEQIYYFYFSLFSLAEIQPTQITTCIEITFLQFNNLQGSGYVEPLKNRMDQCQFQCHIPMQRSEQASRK